MNKFKMPTEESNDDEFSYQEVINLLAELSAKLNYIESSIREFEKQRIDPKFEEMNKRILELERRLKLLPTQGIILC